jgi:hypothetical protein
VRARPSEEKPVDAEQEHEIENITDGRTAAGPRNHRPRVEDDRGRCSGVTDAGEEAASIGLLHRRTYRQRGER